MIIRPKTKRGRATFQAILQSAEDLFSKYGFHQTTIKDITKEAGIGLGTFYLYFEDKLSCYKHLLLSYSHFIRSQIAHKVEGITNREEVERVGLLEFLEIVRDNPHIYHIIWESLYIDRKLFVEYYTNFGKNYATQIESHQQPGGYNGVDPTITAFFLMGVSNFIGLNYVLFNKNSNLELVVDQVMVLLKEGIFQK